MLGKRTDTVALSTQAFVLENARSYRRWLMLAAVLAALALAGYMMLDYIERMFSPAAKVVLLESENQRLTATIAALHGQIEQHRMKSEMDQATRSELENQLTTLNAEMSKLKEELNFFKKAKDKPTKQP